VKGEIPVGRLLWGLMGSWARCGFVFLLLAGLIAPALPAHGSVNPGTWTNMLPMLSPSHRYNAAMAYDSESDRLILFGGATNQGDAGDTWAYDLAANAWTNRAPSPGPAARHGHAMAYDAGSDRIVMYGGDGSQDVWAYDFNSNAWIQKKDAPLPALFFPAMAYDAASDRTLLFGGDAGYGVGNVNDIWSYDFRTDTWTLETPSQKPPARFYDSMAYSAAAHRTIMFGGMFLNDTWSYDSANASWTRLDTVGAPDVNYAASQSFAYDSSADVFLFYSDGAWAFDLKTNTWGYLAEHAPYPDVSLYAAFSYDSGSDRLVLFGGVGRSSSSSRNGTWTYDLRATPGGPGSGPVGSGLSLWTVPVVAVSAAGAGVLAFVVVRRRKKRKGQT